jgi:hypothetical protein
MAVPAFRAKGGLRLAIAVQPGHAHNATEQDDL